MCKLAYKLCVCVRVRVCDREGGRVCVCNREGGREGDDPVRSFVPVILDDHPNTSEAAVYNWKP